MRMLPLTILCALLGLTYWVGATVLTNKIETDIASRSSTAIEQYQDNINLTVDGRDVTLTGNVPDSHTRVAALETVDAVFGVRATRDALSLMGNFGLYSRFQNGLPVTAKGAVDKSAMKTIDVLYPQSTVMSGLLTDARPLANGQRTLKLAADAIDQMNHAELWLNEEQLKITGEAADQQTKADIEAQLHNQRHLIDPLQLITDITAPTVAAIVHSNPCESVSTLQGGQPVETVLFDVDSDIVQSPYEDAIAQFANRVMECVNAAQATLIVEAHADHDGSEEYNYELSLRRAQKVVAQLTTHGLDARQIENFAFGETRPVASNETNSDKSFNRRVEVRYITDSAYQTFISTNNAE